MPVEPTRDFDIATTAGKLRALIGDTKADPLFEFTDSELEFFYSEAGDELHGAAAYACLAWAGRISAGWERVSTDAFSRDRSGAAATKRALAADFMKLSDTVNADYQVAVFGRGRIDWGRRTTLFPLRDRQMAEDEEGA